MADWVLDASAVLAVVLTEPGGDMVRPLIADSLLSAVNLAEVTTRLLDLGFPSARIDSRLERLRFTVVPFDEGLALSAGLLRAQTRHLGLSVGDRACLALAQREQLPALTADRSWAKLDVGVEVVLIR
ncbi:MAG: type II toxin-antitoxin system VapC family toxin [Caulobacter sp.]|nr:type II toxin-antitoxin system VapC family toxin [Caulobacter sp.]